jgi:curli biogenesis system outer membrane secretion channel CsgG
MQRRHRSILRERWLVIVEHRDVRCLGAVNHVSPSLSLKGEKGHVYVYVCVCVCVEPSFLAFFRIRSEDGRRWCVTRIAEKPSQAASDCLNTRLKKSGNFLFGPARSLFLWTDRR